MKNFEQLDLFDVICCTSNTNVLKRISISLSSDGDIYRCNYCKNVYEIKKSNRPNTHELRGLELKFLMDKGVAKRTYRNKNCPNDCKNIEIIASTECDPGPVCGEGRYSALIKCTDCNGLYFQNVYINGCDTSDIEVFHAIKYQGKLDEETLKTEINKMVGRIDYLHLSNVRRKSKIV